MNVDIITDKIDVQLKQAASSKRIGEILAGLGYITESQLYRALEYQKNKGGRLGWILSSLGIITRLELYEALSRHFGLPFITDVSYMMKNIDKNLAAMVTHKEIMEYQALPFRLKRGVLYVLTAEPDTQENLNFFKSRFGVNQVSQMIITDLDLMKVSDELYRDTILDMSIYGLFYREPEESAHRVFSRPQLIGLLVLLCSSAAWLYFSANTFLISVMLLIQAFYFVSILFKAVVSIWGLEDNKKVAFTKESTILDEKELPIYTILVPAYKEAEVMGTLVKSLKKLDYPEDKLDIILLLEENDEETLDVAKQEKPASNWRFITLPDSMPKTKPKALNYGLHFARGDYLTIYDAEDAPEPDQLKKAIAAFRKYPDDYVCFQSALNYFNKDENFLTRMFTLEYSYWFDCLLPGLDKLGLPVPLGGTSNHFDVHKLRQLGAWDPFNVTEDADLGIRASAEGYKVGVINSTTYEEANSRLGNWIRQRSRWVKGYMQTFLVHNRHPVKAIKTMGMKQWFGYNLLVGGTPAVFLINPIMWALFIYYLVADVPIFDPFSSSGILLFLAAFNLFFGNTFVVFFSMIGALPRKYYHLLPYALLSPIYWVLQSVGAYKALWQLLTNPYYWEKTDHGLTNYNILHTETSG